MMTWGHILYYPKVAKYYFKAAKILWQLKKYLSQQHKKNIKNALPIEENYDYFSNYYNRTQQYMFANFFFGEWLSTLRGARINAEERERFVWLSSCAPIFDDFFEENSNPEHILQLLQTPEFSLAQTPQEQTAVFFFKRILNSLQEQESISSTAQHLFEAQQRSKIQKSSSTLNIQQALNISIQKGGYSGQIYAELLDIKEHKAELLHLAYLLGAYGQLMDDVYDLYDDSIEGIKSFANLSGNIIQMNQCIENQKTKILQFTQTHFRNNKGYKDFCHIICIFNAMVQLPLLHYKEIEKRSGTSPNNCLSLDRKLWITDMEKPINMIKLFNLSAQEMYLSDDI